MTKSCILIALKENSKMAKPIKPTPTLRNEDAERLVKQANQRIHLSVQKISELDEYASLYRKLSRPPIKTK